MAAVLSVAAVYFSVYASAYIVIIVGILGVEAAEASERVFQPSGGR